MSWPKEKLSKVATIIRGVTFSKADGIEHAEEGRVPVIRAGSIQKRLLINSGQIWVPKEKVKDHQYIKQNDILMCTSSGSADLVGKCAKSDADYFVSFGAFCAGIRPDLTKISPSYLYHFLCSPKFKNWTKNSSGANIKNIRASELADFEIPLPPLKEQQRIAAILDKADAIRQKRKQAIELADEFLRSVFLDMFGDPVTNPKGWEIKPLNKFTEVVTGNTPPRKDPENYGDHIEWIKSDNINTPSHYLTKATEKLSEQGKIKGRAVMEGAVLMTCIAGSLSCIGNIAIADREVTFNQQINAIVPTAHSISEYIYGLMLVSKKQIQEHSTNAMKGMISKGVLSAMTFPCPPKVEQQKYAKVFQSYMGTMNNLNSHSQQSNELFNSLSQKAFSGQL